MSLTAQILNPSTHNTVVIIQRQLASIISAEFITTLGLSPTFMIPASEEAQQYFGPLSYNKHLVMVGPFYTGVMMRNQFCFIGPDHNNMTAHQDTGHKQCLEPQHISCW